MHSLYAFRTEKAMSKQVSLWDYAPEPKDADQASRENSRRRAISNLRGTGHWLTLLRVARTIPQPFTLNDVSVAAWQARPEVFGMRGYPYPDNHKVHYILYGSRGLIAKGIIKRVREGLFELPPGLDIDNLEATGPHRVSEGPKNESELKSASD
jgi:hypothetical protein